MHRAWNILRPSEKIGPLEIVRKVTTWTRQEAESWYANYLSEELEKDSEDIDSRFDILDL